MNQTLEKEKERGEDPPPAAEEIEKRKKSLRERLKSQAEESVRLAYLIQGIALQEKLQATEEEFNQETEKIVAANADKTEQVQKLVRENHSKILNQITEAKVVRFLMDRAKIKEVIACQR
ncbi:MAG: hypothetical protein HY610_04870 [Elusimicrobia bacterium]|nr:hypothetical protein [Elusimicrobiota bacterium]